MMAGLLPNPMKEPPVAVEVPAGRPQVAGVGLERYLVVAAAADQGEVLGLLMPRWWA
jgi:hypothetical protein